MGTLVPPQAGLLAFPTRHLLEPVPFPSFLESVLHQRRVFLQIPNEGMLLDELELILLGHLASDQLPKGP